MGRLIRDPHGSPQGTSALKAAEIAARAQLDRSLAFRSRVLRPYTREPLNPGDPASSSGVLIDMSELADDVRTAIAAGGSGGVPATRKLFMTPPLLIDGMASADLSADRTLSVSGSVGGFSLASEDFVPSAGQTAFALSQVPGGVVWVVLNDGFYFEPVAFTVVGNLLTWLTPLVAGRPLVLDGNDRMRVYYETTPTLQVADFGAGTLAPIAPGQILFSLPSAPASVVFAVLNDGLYYPPLAFTFVGALVTWSNPLVAGRPLALDPEDRLRFYFA